MEKLQPLLRFPEFKEDWAIKKLEDLCSMQAGKFISASDINEANEEYIFPCYGGNGLRGFTNSFNYQGQYSLIGRQGALCGNITLASNKFYATEHAVVVTVNENIDTIWMYYLLNILNLNQYATGQAQPGLSVQNIKQVETIISKSISEQTKIATFLSAVDEKIYLLKEKKALLEDYKKGMMQQIFSQELRFKDENGKDFVDWEEKSLGDLLKENKERNNGNKITEVFSVAKSKGVINQIEHLGRSYASDNISNYKVVLPNDIVYTKSPTTDFPYGIIKQNKLNRSGVVSVLYGVFTPINEYAGFLIHNYFEDWKNTYNYLDPIVQKGAKNTINIGNQTFLNGAKILFPVDDKEQRKIASFLSAIVEKIELVTQQIEETQKYKKGLLQGMFC